MEQQFQNIKALNLILGKLQEKEIAVYYIIYYAKLKMMCRISRDIVN